MADEQKKHLPSDRSKLGKHAGAHAQRRANGNYARAEYVRSRGHRHYVAQAKRCDRFYLGGGGQWELEDKLKLAESDRKPTEDNQIMQMVNTAIGYQIANRMDIAVLPRGRGADDQSAAVMGKVLKYVTDDCKFHWKETEVFGNGMIQQRGYFDIRMCFEKNIYGEIKADSLDPIDVMPDPDARSYDPEDWGDVTVDRYYTLDQIEQLFGKDARKAMEIHESPQMYGSMVDPDGQPRNRFGTEGVQELAYYSELGDDAKEGLYHVVDRQFRVYEMVDCAVWPTGDIRPVPYATPQQKEAYQQQGAMIVKRMHKRVKWLVSTQNVVLFDDYSPYPWFTIVPFFPFFRGGVTRGMVDNAISPQEVLNKALSQLGHVLNTVANSGWIYEENSLAGMTDDEFEAKAAKNGLLLKVKKEASFKPEKIKAGEVPQGILEVVNQSRLSLVASTGMDEALTSAGPMNEMSGVAYQARQYAAQQKLAVPLDNLARTRHTCASHFIDLVQMYYDTPRLFRITEQDQFGRDQTVPLEVNTPVETEDGQIDYENDLTIGEYDLVISEQPMQITFDNSQFEQVKSLRKDFDYPVPPHIALRYSNLTEKAEIAEAIDAGSQQQPDPLNEARALLAKAQAAKTEVDTINERVKAIYSATQAGVQIATVPQVASLSDEILQSAGFDDQNASPIVPSVGAGLEMAAPEAPLVDGIPEDLNGPAPTSTNPTTPAAPDSPMAGAEGGIEVLGAQ